MTTNTAISYSVATNTAIRSLKAAITACSTPEDIARLLETMEDNAHLLTVLMRDWQQLRQEEAERARQAALDAKASTTGPYTEPIF